MLKSLVRFAKGYLYVELRGCSHERFINLCRHHNIYVWNTTRKNNICTFNILVCDFRKLHPIVAKTKTYPHILDRYGLPFIIAEILGRKSLLPALILFALVIYGLSLIVWDVTITGQCRHTYEELNEYLAENGYKPGMLRSNVDGSKLEAMIRNTYNDISWVSVELSGCNIHIKVIEADIMETKTNDGNTPSDIIASSDGIIESIVTRAGTPCVAAGDAVTKGQVLVSGTVELHDDGGNVSGSEYVFADADISVNTTYPYNDIFTMIYDKKIYTGRSKSSYAIMISDKMFHIENLLNEFETYGKYDIIKKIIDIDQVNLLTDAFMLDKTTYYEYEVISRTYTNEQACTIAREHLHRYMSDLSEDNIRINNKDVSVKIADGMCAVTGSLYVSEPQVLRQNVGLNNYNILQQDDNGLESEVN